MKVVQDYPNSKYAEKAQVHIIEYWLEHNEKTAMIEIKKYLHLFPEGEQVHKINEYYVKDLVKNADRMVQKEKWGEALVLYERIIELAPEYENIHEKIMMCKKEYAYENEQMTKGLLKSETRGWVESTPIYGSSSPKEVVFENTSVQNKKVEIFITDWCPYCKKLEEFLSSNKINYKKYDVENSAQGRDEYSRLGKGGVPIIKVGDRVIRGYNPEAILRAIQ